MWCVVQGVDPSFYSLRWITTLLSREFDLLDTIRLWDSLFADEHRNEFLNYLCCAMVLEQRDAIMVNDFAENMGLVSANLFNLFTHCDVCDVLTNN